MKSVAILQSNYIPWKGYFDIIGSVDEFIIYDDMQYTRRDWRNRNKIKTPAGLVWLTVPVLSRGNYFEPIKDIKIDGSNWSKNHLTSLTHNYKKSKYFTEIMELISPFYQSNKYVFLTDLNVDIIKAICQYLGIQSKIAKSSDYNFHGDASERLANICSQSNASVYLSGPSAKNYINESSFAELGINIQYINYEDYKEYNQLWGKFEHHVTILDMLFCCGQNSNNYLKYKKNEIIGSHNAL